MKKIILILFAVAIVILGYSGCVDKTSLTAPQLNPKSGNANLTTFVTIGNSLTAGYQSGALYKSAQMYCFGKQIADQVGTNFAIPYISDPGIGGRMEVQAFDIAKGQISIKSDGSTGKPLETSYPAPYNNLGIPGALLYDVLNATNSTNCASALAGAGENPFFNIVLRGQGSQFQQAKALHPTFIILWIGNNDILGYATAGGTVPFTPVSVGPVNFTGMYNQLADSIASLGAKVVVANIPDVTSIPYFTTAGPAVALSMSQNSISTFYYQKHGEVLTASGQASPLDLLGMKILITLKGLSYAGDVTGQFYKDYNKGVVPPGINTQHPFGFAPDNPFPDAFVLDESEIADAKATTAAYNAVISAAAQAKGFGLFNINSFFNTAAQAGLSENGIHFTASYITGGLFCLDGIHPTDQGQAILANEFIKVINTKFGAKIPLVDVSTVPNSILLAKGGNYTGHIIPSFSPGSLEHLLY